MLHMYIHFFCKIDYSEKYSQFWKEKNSYEFELITDDSYGFIRENKVLCRISQCYYTLVSVHYCFIQNDNYCFHFV